MRYLLNFYFGENFVTFRNLVFNNLFDTQIKFRILYLYNSFPQENKVLFEKFKPTTVKILLKILSLINLKEVLSGKFRNRLVFNYFKKIDYEISKSSVLKNNILFLDSAYLYTITLDHFYSSFIEEFY